MIELFSLGKIYPSDFLKPGEQPRCEPVELKLVMDEDGIVKLDETAPQSVMFGKYWYRSSTSDTMKKELKDVVDSILSILDFHEGERWLDIACNDGTLLSFVPPAFMRIGIDPADGTFASEAANHANLFIHDFFSAKYFPQTKAKVITAIAMFYAVDNPTQFLKDVYEVLEDDGLFVMQLSYSPLMVYQTAFDNICHEHKYYYNLTNLKKILSDNGFNIMDVQLNDVNGGSFRLYIMKDNADINKFKSQQYRDVCKFRGASLVALENEIDVCNEGYWEIFFNEINLLKKELVSFIRSAKENGKVIYGYGASTKGNTLLQYFGLDNTLITAIAERNSDKWGLVTVGTNIPICSEQEMREAHPDYLLILPWSFITEFKERETEYLQKGGKFIVPAPKFQIISA